MYAEILDFIDLKNAELYRNRNARQAAAMLDEGTLQGSIQTILVLDLIERMQSCSKNRSARLAGAKCNLSLNHAFNWKYATWVGNSNIRRASAMLDEGALHTVIDTVSLKILHQTLLE